jgi:hypothetical protein
MFKVSPDFRLDWETIISELDISGYRWYGAPSPYEKIHRVTSILARRRNPFVHVALKTYQWDPLKATPVRCVTGETFAINKQPSTRGVIIRTWAQTFYFECSKRHTFQSIMTGFYRESGFEKSFYKSFFEGDSQVDPLSRLEALTDSTLHVVYCACDEDGERVHQQ